MYNIEIINLNKRYPLDERFIKNIIGRILKFLKKREDAKFEFIFLDDGSIRVYNKRYKKRDAPTDVLSFKIEAPELGRGKSLCEILISSETAFKNAGIFGTRFPEELVLYIIHGILHISGYDDKNKKDRVGMSKKEEEVLLHLCRTEDLSRVLMPR